MSQLEKAARALWANREKRFPERTRRAEPDEMDMATGAWANVVSDARAVIASIEVDDAMVKAAANAYIVDTGICDLSQISPRHLDAIRAAFEAGIRALLAEGEKG